MSSNVRKGSTIGACPAKRHKKVDDGNKCKWSVETKEKSPHVHEKSGPEPMICDTILDHIGNTPLVRLNKVTSDVECEVVAKCEFFNAGGSVKDRIGRRMVLDAEKQGRIKKGDTLIEPTSGNTGIGLALAAAVRGYKMIITLPEKMSKEKVDVLKGLGAQIFRTPTEAAFDSPDSHIGVAKRLNEEIKDSHILDQYSNPSNPLAHYDGTAEEIWAQCGGKLDAVVLTAGTGGTITGIARKLKEKNPNILVVGVDPHGSILALPESLNGAVSSYHVEGIGYDFIPKVLDRNVVDEWVKTNDKESFLMSRRLIREEGLLCGGSSGSAVVAALQIAKRFKKGQRVVVLLPDSVRNYMTKFLDMDWMVNKGFMDVNPETAGPTWLAQKTVADLHLKTPLTVLPSISVSQCIEILAEHGYDQLPVVSKEGTILGMVTLGNMKSKLLTGRVKATTPVRDCLYKQLKKVSNETSLQQLNQIFNIDHFALVVTSQKVYSTPSSTTEKSLVVGIATPIDLLRYIVKNEPKSPSSSSSSSSSS